VDVESDANSASNTVHTVTIADSVLACLHLSVPEGTYTVVNEPQWTWQQVFEHYRNTDTDVDLRFVGSRSTGNGGLVNKLVSIASDIVGDRTTKLMSAGYLLPDTVNQFVFNKYMQNDVRGQIGKYESRFGFHLREFDYAAAPGPTVPNLESTNARLKQWEYPPAIFES
jgi:hypothetical protein